MLLGSRRAGQGSADRPAAPGRGDHRRGPLRPRPRPAGGAPCAHHHHERPGAAARADRGREARPGGARDRGHRHAHAAGAGGRRRGARDSHRARRAPDDGPRRHPPPGRRDAGPAHQPVPVLRLAGRAAGGDRRGHRLPLHRQAGDEQQRQGPEQDRRPGRRAEGLGLRHGRRPRRQGRVIVEGFIDFDYEITQLTVRALGGWHGQVARTSASPSATCRSAATTWKAGSRTP
jgi:hypothetical protein